MNALVVKKTQDRLGKVIKKPPLTEKLLSKPPFRYLHDIFSEVIRTTGFMKGLYGENEMKSDRIMDKDSKMAFLQKVIDVVMLVSGKPLAAKPARIVAGHEPEKTNELLQAIAKCCLKKMSSDDAVKRVLKREKVDMKTKAGTSKSHDKENREGREHHVDRAEKKKITERSSSRDQKDPDQPKEQESRRRDGEKKHHRDRERSDKHHRSEQAHHAKDKERDKEKTRERDSHRDKERDKEKTRERDSHRDKDRDKEKTRERDSHRDKERDKEKTRERDSHRDKDRDKEKTRERDTHRDKERDKEKTRERDTHRDKERDREKTRERDSHRDKERDKEKTRERDSHRDKERDREKRSDGDKEREKRERHKDVDERKKSGQSDNSKARLSEEPQQKAFLEEPSKVAKPVPASETPAKIPRPPSAKGQRRRPEIGDQDGDAQLAHRHVPQENGNGGSSVPADMASSSKRIARPSSARPAPPRVKSQESYTDVTPAERLSRAKPSAPIIMDGKKISEEEKDEDEQFLVEEAVLPPSDAPEMQAEHTQELDKEEQHGGLVKKILETKKDYEVSQVSPKSKEQNVVSEVAQKKERDMVTQETERLRSSIQMVCRSALPLGKVMDYIQVDMDAMQAELLSWRRENKEHAQALLQEQRATDRAVDPLKAELAELEQLIEDQQDMICAVRSNILNNEEKIQKMVTGINFFSRTSTINKVQKANAVQ